ncbi:uncharacterized protein LOC132188625 [Corylus avellana]|uniref:uncharacterized protein LOC132188625 n=1 Tax=Corylus avellana TaxID=13451 RepID=UPI001E1EBF9D|nr:uncharacterized protein LOC132188625 [Corylus avellana]
MAPDQQPHHPNPTETRLIPAVQGPTTRFQIPLRRRKLPTVRLGGKKPRRAFILARVFRRIRLRWLKLQYTCMLKKLREYYRNLVKDIVDAGATLETFHQRVLMEASLAVPVMGVSFNNYPSVSGSGRP